MKLSESTIEMLTEKGGELLRQQAHAQAELAERQRHVQRYEAEAAHWQRRLNALATQLEELSALVEAADGSGDANESGARPGGYEVTVFTASSEVVLVPDATSAYEAEQIVREHGTGEFHTVSSRVIESAVEAREREA